MENKLPAYQKIKEFKDDYELSDSELLNFLTPKGESIKITLTKITMRGVTLRRTLDIISDLMLLNMLTGKETDEFPPLTQKTLEEELNELNKTIDKENPSIVHAFTKKGLKEHDPFVKVKTLARALNLNFESISYSLKEDGTIAYNAYFTKESQWCKIVLESKSSENAVTIDSTYSKICVVLPEEKIGDTFVIVGLNSVGEVVAVTSENPDLPVILVEGKPELF